MLFHSFSSDTCTCIFTYFVYLYCEVYLLDLLGLGLGFEKWLVFWKRRRYERKKEARNDMDEEEEEEEEKEEEGIKLY